jgi:hypothetical protein
MEEFSWPSGQWQSLVNAIAACLEVLWQQIANFSVALLTPAAGIALVLGLWRVTADLGWTEAFPISQGFFSHWQVWIALAIGLKAFSSSLPAPKSRNSKIPQENG